VQRRRRSNKKSVNGGGDGVPIARLVIEGGTMTLVIAVLIGALQTGTLPDGFVVRCDLQAIYDEMASTTVASRSPADIDMFHSVFYTQDWAFVDADHQRHEWTEVRRQQIDALQQPALEMFRMAIQTLTQTTNGAAALVHVITVRRFTDVDGKYGKPGLVHTIAEITTMRDTWMQAGSLWRLQLREQLAAPQQLIDKLPPDIESPRCPTF
jgi:hypothetical protein